MIPHSRPLLDISDEEALVKVLRSGQLAQGEEVQLFEEEMARLIGVKHAIAVSSGTAALHLALLSLDTGEGDEVIIPSFVCSALLQAVRYTGARAVLVDIKKDDFNIDPDKVREKISPRTKAIIVPHMFGLPADIDELIGLRIPMIEDCAQSLGSFYKGKPTGSHGTLSIFSFYATKMISAGEGGMVLTDDDRLAFRIRDMRQYDEHVHDAVRFNYKLTDLGAALGRSQLRKLDHFLRRRREIAGIYRELFEKMGVPLYFVPPDRTHVYFRYCVRFSNADSFLKEMNLRGITCRRPVFYPLHYYLKIEGFPITDHVWRETVSIPLYPGLTDKEISYICETIIALEKKGVISYPREDEQ